MASISKKQKKPGQKPPKSRPGAISALSQPVVAGSASLTALSSFSPDGHSFALLTLAVDKHRLRVFDVANGNVSGEYVLQVSFGTCLQWTKISTADGGRPSSPSKKRKRTAQESENAAPGTSISVVLLGLANGGLTFFSPARGTTVLSLSHPLSTAAILSAAMGADESCVWTSSADGSIYLWDIHSNTIVQSWKSINKSPYSNISLMPRASTERDEAQQILAASHSIDLIEVSSENTAPKTVSSFSGHVTKITSMKWISSPQQPRFVTSAERDRFVQGWTVPSSGKDGKMSFSASVDGDVRKIQVTPDGKLFLVVSSTGIVCLFAPPTTSTSALKPLEPLSVLAFSIPKGKSMTATYDVLDATFASDNEGTIQVARLAEGARPVFQSIRFTDDEGGLIPKLSVKSVGLTKRRPEEELSSSRRYRESDGLNLGSGIVAPNDSTTNEVGLELENGTLDAEMAELSLGQRLRAMQRGEDEQLSPSDSDSDQQTKTKTKKGREPATIEVPTESLSRTLIQALHSSDAKLLEGCLRHSDPTIIQNTVTRIPPQLAVSLLQACVERLARGRGGNTGRSRGSAASAQRGTVMIAWIKVVLVVHSGHLMTMPNLVSRLASLHATLTTRLALQERLLLLNGRLDLALSQVELRSATAPTKLSSKKGKSGDRGTKVTRYVEGESSDDEVMEVDVQEGSDVGDIEDIGLGGKSNQQSDSDDDDSADESSEDEEESGSDEAEDDDLDEDDDDDEEEEEESENEPLLNGFIDDEAEESWGSAEEEEREEE